MKREKNFCYFLVMITFIICFTVSLIIACRTVKIGNLTPTAAFIVYPMTYFLAVLFAEKYGKQETKTMFCYAIFALIIMVLFITISSTLPVFNNYDGLEPIFNMNYRLMFASIVAFYLSQCLNLEIYYYISGFRGFKFLIAGVIAATIDSFLFVTLAFVGDVSFAALLEKFTSQYVVNIFMIIIYTILFTYIIDTVIESNNKKAIVNVPVKETKLKDEKTYKDTKPKKKSKIKKETK